MIRVGLSISILVAVLLSSSEGSASHSQVRIAEAAGDRYASNGTVEVHATAAEVSAAISDFKNWPTLFSDVKSVKVKHRTPTDTIVDFESRTLGHAHELRIHTGDPNRLRFEIIDGHGIQLWGEFSLKQLSPHITGIQGLLHSDVTGVFGWFLSDRSVREQRRTKLRSDLEDLSKRFANSTSTP